MLLLNGLRLTCVDLIRQGGDLVSGVGDLLLKSLVVGLERLNLAVLAVQLALLQSHGLLEGVNLPLKVTLLISQV